MERVDGKFMLKIAFCDDDLEILKELGILLDKETKTLPVRYFRVP